LLILLIVGLFSATCEARSDECEGAFIFAFYWFWGEFLMGVAFAICVALLLLWRMGEHRQ
jgi:hypothetical protein